MIQFKKPYTHIINTEAHIGILKIEVVAYKISKTYFQAFIEDSLHLPNGSVIHINSREKTFPIEQYNQISAYVKQNVDVTALNELEIIDKVIDVQSLLMVQSDLFENGTTSYGKLPQDWEQSSIVSTENET